MNCIWDSDDKTMKNDSDRGLAHVVHSYESEFYKSEFYKESSLYGQTPAKILADVTPK